MTLMREGSIEQVSRLNFLMFGISAMLTLFSYPLIYLFERIFGMITDVSLIELSDTNSKLLRELAIKSPGTFQHSLIVSNIAEGSSRKTRKDYCQFIHIAYGSTSELETQLFICRDLYKMPINQELALIIEVSKMLRAIINKLEINN